MARILVSALALSFASVLPTAAFAAPAGAESQSVEVGFGDLDLASEHGVARLDRRIRYAAIKVCGTADRRALAESQRALTCQKAAVAGTSKAVQLAIASARGGADYAANAVNVRAGPGRAAE